MQIAIPETNKKPGVCYAVTDDGLELPVIDVTHPAFAIHISDSELDRLLQEHVRSTQRQGRLSKFIQPLVLKLMARRSMIMQGIAAAAGGFMSGMNTYLLKLGPDNLGRGYAGEIDRQISGSISGLSVRLRLQDVAYLLADGLVPLLAAGDGKALHLLNIGGGPSIDSLNALLVMRKQQPQLLAGRHIAVHVLDLDEAGPSFALRALVALQAEGAPLTGLDIGLQHIPYDWSKTDALRSLLSSFGGGAIVAASSEGALFEYGSDEEITANLQALHDGTPADTIIAGSVTRADATGRLLNTASRAALKLRGLEVFAALIRQAGWTVARNIERPMTDDVCLVKI